MNRNLQDNLSYIIRFNGEFVPAMPEDEEFSIQEIRDYVAGPPEVVCFTSDGYVLFHNHDAKLKCLPANPEATVLKSAASGDHCIPSDADYICGRAFLAHPHHIPTFWSRGNNPTVRPSKANCSVSNARSGMKSFTAWVFPEDRMTCKQCAAETLKDLNVEVTIHFPGSAGLNKTPVLAYPKLMICLKCGHAEFVLPDTQLEELWKSLPTSVGIVRGNNHGSPQQLL